MDECVVEPLIILARQRAVQIVTFAVVDAAGRGGPAGRLGGRRGADVPVPPRLAEHLAAVNGLRKNYWTDRIVKVQMIAANQPRDVGRQRRGGERARRDDDR